jgi:ABC-type dipeptide/oligopeptide/nickel transport system ATPase subunit/uncharacterized protein YfcZ (UPF0381/DUF406 family)
MTPNERKDWLTYISGIDFEYAFKVYNRLKGELRDIKAQMKLLGGKLSTLDGNILSDKELEALGKDRETLKSLIRQFSERIVVTPDDNSIDKELKGLLSQLVKPESGSEITEKIDDLKQTHTRITERGVMLNKEYVKREEYDSLTDKDLSVLERDIRKLEEEIRYLKSIDTFKTDDYRGVTHFIESNINRLWTLSEDISGLLGETSRGDKEKIVKSYTLLVSKREQTDRKLYTYMEKLKELKNLIDEPSDSTCPKCGYTCDNKHLTVEYNDVLKKVEEINTFMVTLKKDIDAVESRIRNIEKKESLINEFKDIFRHSGQTRLYAYISDEDFRSMVKKLEGLLLTMEEKLKIDKKVEEKKQILSKIAFIRDNSSREIRPMEEIKRSISDNVEEEKKIRESLTLALREKKRLEAYEKGISELKEVIRKVPGIKGNRIKKLRNDFLRKAIQDVTVVESEIISRIESDIYDKRLRKQYQEDIDALTIRMNDVQELINEMSPSKGLIADTIVSFLNQFMDSLNKVINRIWTYRLEILPRRDSESAIDYKFPVSTDNGASKDIRLTSTGMQEIINVAFRIMVMRLLDIKDYPLYLDEFAASFDEEHRVNAFNVLEDLTGSNEGQIFIVSHYYSNYGGLANSELVVMSTDNIRNLNEEYNTNIVMK